MKFTHGAWQFAKGVTGALMRRTYRHKVDGDTLYIALLDRSGAGGDRFEGTIIELQITAPMDDVIRIKVKHHSPRDKIPDGFDLVNIANDCKFQVEENDKQLMFRSGNIRLCINRESFEITFETIDGAQITRGGNGSIGYMRTDADHSFLMQRLSLGIGECIYGLGERFGPLVKNGQTVTIWNEDGGTKSDLAYKNLPFYLSSAGYGLLVNTPGKVEFEIATERVSEIQFCVPGESLDYFLFYGPDPKRVLELYTSITGRPAIPPAWSFGLWLSSSFTTHYDEKTVNEFIDGMAQREIPLSVFHFDCFWMKERQWCDFQWDRNSFPDPEGMIQRIKARGLKVCVWINSYIAQMSALFNEGRENGYFLKQSDGSVYQRDAWQPGMALVDFTNPDACHWYQKQLRQLLNMGVDCFKTDFGELIPTDVVYHDGSDPNLMHNYYSYLYNKCVFDLLEDYHGKGNAIVFARSATVGCQKYPVHWGGDCEATWESMAEDLRGGLSFCLSGPAFWSHDIGGFAGKANPLLYKRWIAFGLLSSHSRLHGSESYRVPWLFDEESVDVMRAFVELKNSLFPYLYSTAHEAGKYGYPMMRAMILEYPSDPTCRYLDRQYMLGSSLLVAPVFRQDNLSEYYLPSGRWTNYFTGEIVEGGQWRREKVDVFQVPLWVRENSIIVESINKKTAGWKISEPLNLRLYQIADRADFLINIYTVGNSGIATIRCQKEGKTISLEWISDLKPETIAKVIVNHERELLWENMTERLVIEP